MAFPQTGFYTSMPSEPEELIVHAIIGILFGFFCAFFVVTHCRVLLLLRNIKLTQRLFSLNLLIFPALGALVISSMNFPQGLGRYILSTRREWEHRQLRDRLDFQRLQIDHVPFQLVEQTSLYKAHSSISLLSLQRAYVTRHGKLVVVVALKEPRRALEYRPLQLFQSDGESALSYHANNFSQKGLIDTSLKPAPGSNLPKSIIELQQRF